jgi:hypothetical protein
MPAINQTRNIFIIGIAVVVAAISIIGCGGNENESSEHVDFGKGTLAGCLKQSGAKFANSAANLQFFSEAEDEGTASKFGFTYDKSVELFVQLWEDNYDPSDWLMWSAQSFDDDMAPVEIVESGAAGSYVAYLFKPTPSQRRAAQRCTA